MSGVRCPAMTVGEFREWRGDARLWSEQYLALIESTGHTALIDHGNGHFGWICPGCGALAGGDFGDEPVSGWDAPRWTREGDADHLTLQPSLGCPFWRAGECEGHYWLRDGWLVIA